MTENERKNVTDFIQENILKRAIELANEKGVRLVSLEMDFVLTKDFSEGFGGQVKHALRGVKVHEKEEK